MISIFVVDPNFPPKGIRMGRRQSAPAPCLHKHGRNNQPREHEWKTGNNRQPGINNQPTGSGPRLAHAQYNSPTNFYSNTNFDDIFKNAYSYQSDR